MCGIAGAVNAGDSLVLQQMIDVIAHRGPDDEGIWHHRSASGDWVGLGSRRLAILDLSPAGHMPLSTPDGQLTIVFNGEIYNHLDLRRQYLSTAQFRSTGDTETLLLLYEKLGLDCLKLVNGMFAFALWDSRQQQLVIARDHFGIKPLYYYQQNQALVFASEIKAILQHRDIPRQMDYKALHQYLTFLWVPEPDTIFAGIHKLPVGHFGVFQNGRLQIEPYWDLRMPPADHTFPTNQAALADELRQRLQAAVKSQMLSDVPLGAFLSAGLDSSSIVSLMKDFTDEPIRTYTIAFPKRYGAAGGALDNTDVARRTAAQFGCEHTEIVTDPDVVELLPRLIWHMDEPVADPAIITAFLVNREARKTVTVLLSGIGGDEIYAGYRKYQAHYLAQWYQRIPSLLRRGVIEPFVMALPAMYSSPRSNYIRLAKKMARSGSLSPQERFLTDSVYLSEAAKANLYLPAVGQRAAGFSPFEQHNAMFANVASADFLNRMLYVDMKVFMPSLNLNYNDKMSMASSVEVRVPFLDWELAEWSAWNIAPNLKLRQGISKHILREAMRPTLPAEVLKQKKAGFGAPAAHWIKTDLQEMVGDLLSPERLRARGLFNPAAVRQLLNEHLVEQHDWSLQIWQLLTLELWQQQFLDSTDLPAADTRVMDETGSAKSQDGRDAGR